MLLTFGLVLSLIPAGLRGENTGREFTRLGLLVDVSAATPDKVLAAFRGETERVLPIPGLEIQWRRAGNEAATETFDRLIVVRLAGECSPHGSAASRGDGPLGVTHVSGGQILPFVEADCGRIVRASQRLRRLPFRLRAEDLGRAIGRVVAHEVYHVLSASSEHDEQGLSRSALSAADLFLSCIAFDPAALERMAAGLPRPARPVTFAPEASGAR